MSSRPELPDFPAASPKAGRGKPAGAAAAGIVALAAIIGVSVEQAGTVVGDVDRHESGGRQRLVAFRDSVGIWTICGGIITWPDGRRVKQGDRATEGQCRAVTVQQINERARPLVRGVPQLYGRYYQLRAVIDLSFNCGVGGAINGAVGQRIRAGNWAGASAAILQCDKGSFAKPQRGLVCRKKVGPGWLCTIPGLTARREDNKRMFDVARPAQGVR